MWPRCDHDVAGAQASGTRPRDNTPFTSPKCPAVRLRRRSGELRRTFAMSHLSTRRWRATSATASSCGARRGASSTVRVEPDRTLHGRGVAPSQPALHPRSAAGWVRRGGPACAAAAAIVVLGFGALVGSFAGGSSASDVGVIVVRNPLRRRLPDRLGGHPLRPAATGRSPRRRPRRPRRRRAPAPSTSTPRAKVQPAAPILPPIKHVFLIVLSNQGYTQSFGDSASNPYLAKTLAAKGELISNYYAVAGGSLANEIASSAVRDRRSRPQANCPQYQDIQPATIDESGQVSGDGCGYPGRHHRRRRARERAPDLQGRTSSTKNDGR